VTEVITQVWQAAEQICGKRLVRALPLWLPHYERHFGKLLPRQKKLLGEVSAATLDRLLRQLKAGRQKGLGGTKPGTLLRQQIPIQGEVWNESKIGFLEADSVAHCGGSLAGDFIWSLTYPDLASTWTEGRAIWNKGSTGGRGHHRHPLKFGGAPNQPDQVPTGEREPRGIQFILK
jgi:hypothetical protein